MATIDKTTNRINFASSKLKFPYPDFLEIQLKSFQEFFQLETSPENRQNEGLFKVFAENFPITDTRNQFVLDFSNPKVIDYIYGLIDNILATTNIDYIKWDMNRSISVVLVDFQYVSFIGCVLAVSVGKLLSLLLNMK